MSTGSGSLWPVPSFSSPQPVQCTPVLAHTVHGRGDDQTGGAGSSKAADASLLSRAKHKIEKRLLHGRQSLSGLPSSLYPTRRPSSTPTPTPTPTPRHVLAVLGEAERALTSRTLLAPGKGWDREGLYRVPAATTEREQLYTSLLSSLPYCHTPFPGSATEEGIAGVVKLMLMRMEEPLLTRKLRQQWIAAAALPTQETQLLAVRSLLQQLPPAHHPLLHALVHHLRQVAAHVQHNKMGHAALSTVLGPSLLPTPEGSALADVAEGAKAANRVVLFLLDHAGQLGSRWQEGAEGEVPVVLQGAFQWLQGHGLQYPALYSPIPSSHILLHARISALRDMALQGAPPPWDTLQGYEDAPLVAELVKRYLVDMPRPLIPYGLQASLMVLVQQDRMAELWPTVHLLSDQQLQGGAVHTLDVLCGHLAQVVQAQAALVHVQGTPQYMNALDTAISFLSFHLYNAIMHVRPDNGVGAEGVGVDADGVGEHVGHAPGAWTWVNPMRSTAPSGSVQAGSEVHPSQFSSSTTTTASFGRGGAAAGAGVGSRRAPNGWAQAALRLMHANRRPSWEKGGAATVGRPTMAPFTLRSLPGITTTTTTTTLPPGTSGRMQAGAPPLPSYIPGGTQDGGMASHVEGQEGEEKSIGVVHAGSAEQDTYAHCAQLVLAGLIRTHPACASSSSSSSSSAGGTVPVPTPAVYGTHAPMVSPARGDGTPLMSPSGRVSGRALPSKPVASRPYSIRVHESAFPPAPVPVPARAGRGQACALHDQSRHAPAMLDEHVGEEAQVECPSCASLMDRIGVLEAELGSLRDELARSSGSSRRDSSEQGPLFDGVHNRHASGFVTTSGGGEVQGVYACGGHGFPALPPSPYSALHPHAGPADAAPFLDATSQAEAAAHAPDGAPAVGPSVVTVSVSLLSPMVEHEGEGGSGVAEEAVEPVLAPVPALSSPSASPAASAYPSASPSSSPGASPAGSQGSQLGQVPGTPSNRVLRIARMFDKQRVAATAGLQASPPAMTAAELRARVSASVAAIARARMAARTTTHGHEEPSAYDTTAADGILGNN